MREFTLPIKCTSILKGLFFTAMGLLWYVALIHDPFWISKIGTLGDRPDYWGRLALIFAGVPTIGYIWIYCVERGWRFPIRCKCDKEDGI